MLKKRKDHLSDLPALERGTDLDSGNVGKIDTVADFSSSDSVGVRYITVRGAREHNLRDVSLCLPRDRLIVFTGLSGSGKSSLAFDTIYAEGQRRYVESLSSYARQFLQMMDKPDVDLIEGLSPAISIEQKTTSKNPRSTVGTVTEIYDYMRLLFARVGIAYSPATGLPIESETVSGMVDRVLLLPSGVRFYLLAPIARGRKGEFRKEIADMMRRGFRRLKIDGLFYEIEDAPALDKNRKHDIDVVVDRVVSGADIGARMAESFETALGLGDGLAFIEFADKAAQEVHGDRLVFSERFSCPVSGFTIDEIEPRLFSFNNPYGACSACDGLGRELYFDHDFIVPDPSLSLRSGAILPWSKTGVSSPYYLQTLESLCAHYGASMDVAWECLDSDFRRCLLEGSDGEVIRFEYDDGDRVYRTEKVFEGIVHNIERRWRETSSDWVRDELSRFQSDRACPTCAGSRLKVQALAVKIGGLHIGEVSEMSVDDALLWFSSLGSDFSARRSQISAPILKEIGSRLKFLCDVGLGYLTLSRSSGTLSGGESQRIRLASQIGSGLTGVLYVLDEPSIGLHQRDNARLLETLFSLRDLGNTVIVVEHDEETIARADHIVDIGPYAGIHGGEIVAQGSYGDIVACRESVTGAYLSGARRIAVPESRRAGVHFLRLFGARSNNLANIDVSVPLSTLTCFTGVSGSGKSTLLVETIYKAVARAVSKRRVTPGFYDRIEGLEFLDKIIDIDQSPIGRTPRSNPATYTGAFTPIRDWFAGLPESRIRGYRAGRFSFNVKGGRCEACSGDGVVRIEMHFLADVYVRCEACGGKRYNRETLEVCFKGKSIADILDMTVREGVSFFRSVPSIRVKLETLDRVGLGYIKIGQQATTLSGGEAQRVKLAKELSRRSTGRSFYILDEPTTGLHFHDVKQLLDVLHDLVSQGNTVCVIEHNLEVIKTADWVIDLGPEGGTGGGHIIVEGTPEDVSAHDGSHTGLFLRKLLRHGVQKQGADGSGKKTRCRKKTAARKRRD